MALSGKTFRLFVSSTFSDLKAERNALQEKVFPRIRDLCLQHGCRFQAVDLRWGVREEAGLDQQTMKICLGEIERCQRVTPRPNFIVLLGDRYGWRPLAPEIPAGEFELIERAVAGAEEKALLRKWYLRDDNAVPPVYVLQPRKIELEGDPSDGAKRLAREEESRRWNEVDGRLRALLRAAMETLDLPEHRRMTYLASATEQEIEAGAMKVEDADKHVFCFFRHIEGLPEDVRAGSFADFDAAGVVDQEARRRLADLKRRLRSRLKANVHEYEAAWREETVTTDHLAALCEEAWRSLSKVILGEISQLEEIDPVAKESDDHEAFGRARARLFFGREAYLGDIAGYFTEPRKSPLALFGASGSGKSALLAKALEQVRKSRPDAVTAARFIGATPASSDIRALLEGLCRQITRAYSGDEKTIPTEFKELSEEFPKRLALATAERPLVLFLDALDQLSESQNAHSLFWLPKALPDNVFLIISTAPGDCWDKLETIIPPSCRIDLRPLSTSEGDRILDAWLGQAGRTLQAHQRREILDRFAMNGLPLYLKFAFEEARSWRSTSAAAGLPADVTGIIRRLFSRLSAESNHGPIFVARSLAYLRAAKNGLSEDEVIDVLSRDPEVFEDFQKRSFFKPPEPRLPVVVWSRFYFDLEPYLNERRADGVTLMGFFHRQMGDVVDADYLAGGIKAKIHSELAAYFTGQPLFIAREDGQTANLRKLSELPFQQVHGELWEALYETLTDFDFLEAKCTHSGVILDPKDEKGSRLYGGVYELIEDYQRALERFPQ